MAYEPIVEELVKLIHEYHWDKAFETAVESAHRAGVPELDDIKTVDDYLRYINELLRWVPEENTEGREVYDRICKFYFVLDQPSLLALQTPVAPEDDPPKSTRLS